MLLLKILGNQPSNFSCVQLLTPTLYSAYDWEGETFPTKEYLSPVCTAVLALVSSSLVKFAKLSQQDPNLDQSQPVERQPHWLWPKAKCCSALSVSSQIWILTWMKKKNHHSLWLSHFWKVGEWSHLEWKPKWLLLCLLHWEAAVYTVVQNSRLQGQWDLSPLLSCGYCFVDVIRLPDLAVFCFLICKAGLITAHHSCPKS